MLAGMQAGELRPLGVELEGRNRTRVLQSEHFDASDGKAQPRISIAIPVYNEEAVLPELVRRVTAVLDTAPGGPHEIIFVDDGSSDRTLAMLERAAERDSRIVVVALSRNFGHQSALTAALDHVSGDVAILMDGDLQDPPEAVPTLLQWYDQGYDVVFVRRTDRKEAWWLRACYHVFYRAIAALSSLQLPLDAGDFGLISRAVINEMRRMPEHHRYLRGLRTWVGFRQIGIAIPRAARHAGESKYSTFKLLKLAFDGIFAFSIVPLRAASLVGATAVGFSGLFSLYSLYVKFWLHSPQGFTALILAMTFFSGVNLFFLGIIGEYVGRIYEEVKARPQYVVRKLTKKPYLASHEGLAIANIESQELQVCSVLATGTN